MGIETLKPFTQKQFLHISFSWSGKTKIDELLPKFDLALDWVRYAPNCWIVYTTSNADKWYGRLSAYLGKGDHMLICRLDVSEKQGWLPSWIWDWLNNPDEKRMEK